MALSVSSAKVGLIAAPWEGAAGDEVLEQGGQAGRRDPAGSRRSWLRPVCWDGSHERKAQAIE